MLPVNKADCEVSYGVQSFMAETDLACPDVPNVRLGEQVRGTVDTGCIKSKHLLSPTACSVKYKRGLQDSLLRAFMCGSFTH